MGLCVCAVCVCDFDSEAGTHSICMGWGAARFLRALPTVICLAKIELDVRALDLVLGSSGTRRGSSSMHTCTHPAVSACYAHLVITPLVAAHYRPA